MENKSEATQMDRGMTFEKRYFLRFSIGIITELSYQNIVIYVMYELMPFYLIQSPSNPTSMRILIQISTSSLSSIRQIQYSIRIHAASLSQF
jgi:hypothetical protein